MNFFGRHFLTFVDSGGFALQKTKFLYLHQEKVLCYTQFKMYYNLKIHIFTKSTFFCDKNLEIIDIIYLKTVGKKIIKHFTEKSLSVFGEAHGRPLNTLNFFWPMVLFFFFSHKFAGII